MGYLEKGTFGRSCSLRRQKDLKGKQDSVIEIDKKWRKNTETKFTEIIKRAKDLSDQARTKDSPMNAIKLVEAKFRKIEFSQNKNYFYTF